MSNDADQITVSIITPCYNASRFIERTIESALGQTRPPLEVIVVDDGSTDDSARIAGSFGPPVRVLRQSNRGESVARNRALAEASGSHVLFLDADDLLEASSLEHLTEAIGSGTNAVAVMGCAWFTQDPSTRSFVKIPKTSSFYPGIIASNLAPPHCWLTPKEVILRAGGFAPDLKWFEDWDLWWRVGLLGVNLVPVSFVGALYRQHAESQLATTKPADRARGHAALMSRMAETLVNRPEMLAQYGEQLFWSCFTALRRARDLNVSWTELAPLAVALRNVVTHGPMSVRRSRLARSMRLLGVRGATRLHAATARR